MRKKSLLFLRKLEFRFCRVYTWLLRGSFKSCGRDVHIHFPIRIEQPGAISLGSGVLIYPRTWINAVSEWAGVKYQGEVRIGDRVSISYGVQISAADSVVIEDEATLASGVVIVDHTHDHRHPDIPVFRAPLSKPSPVRIGKGSFLGVYSFIGPGVQIGEHAVVAANSVVTKDVPAYAMAMGNPARIFPFLGAEAKISAVAELNGVERAESSSYR